MTKQLFLVSIFMLTLTGGLAQSKRDLEEKVARQEKTIDSLNKVIANMENIIENRDRSIKIMRQDFEKYKEETREANEALARERNTTARLRAQQSTGKAKIMTLNNSRSTLKVKEGHVWRINQFMTDYTSSVETDSLGNPIIKEVHVFLKKLNDDELTNISQGMYGPKLFSSLHPEQMIQFPIILPEKTSFTIQVMTGDIGNLTAYQGDVYCSFTEKAM